MKKEYLGDGVYVAIETGMVKLTTEDGIDVGNVIYLEEEVMDALLDYWKRTLEAYRGAKAKAAK